MERVIVLDNKYYADIIRKTTWGVDMREPIAKALENELDVHQQRTVAYRMEPIEIRENSFTLVFTRGDQQ